MKLEASLLRHLWILNYPVKLEASKEVRNLGSAYMPNCEKSLRTGTGKNVEFRELGLFLQPHAGLEHRPHEEQEDLERDLTLVGPERNTVEVL